MSYIQNIRDAGYVTLLKRRPCKIPKMRFPKTTIFSSNIRSTTCINPEQNASHRHSKRHGAVLNFKKLCRICEIYKSSSCGYKLEISRVKHFRVLISNKRLRILCAEPFIAQQNLKKVSYMRFRVCIRGNNLCKFRRSCRTF
jgi:hypothetical protein